MRSLCDLRTKRNSSSTTPRLPRHADSRRCRRPPAKANDATDLTYFTAKVTGEIERPANPDPAFDTHCRFEYVSELEYQPRNEIQKVCIYARARESFTLTFQGVRTTPILFNSSPAAVRRVLKRSPISAGRCHRLRRPGNLSASHPYIVEFTGTLA